MALAPFDDTPAENAFIESFNGRLRDECLNVHQFASIEHARATIEAWRVDDDQRRPHSSLGHLTPVWRQPNVDHVGVVK